MQDKQVVAVIMEHGIGFDKIVGVSLPASSTQETFRFEGNVKLIAGRTYSVKFVGADMCLEQQE